MSVEIADLLAKRFIARRDVKAIQHRNGAWSPHQEYNPQTGKYSGERIPWKRSYIHEHLNKAQTYGHYLLNQNNECKFFAFDIDLEKKGVVMIGDNFDIPLEVEDLRAAWLDRKHPGRPWIKLQFKLLAHKIAQHIQSQLDLPVAVAYSGSKGVHVYAFTGLISAMDAREGAEIVMDCQGEFEAVRGSNFYKHRDTDPENGFPNLSVEVFPKQVSLDGKDGLGNLMRLPLGRNLKSKDPTFFVDMRSPMGQMVPRDPIQALTAGSPWDD